MTFLTPLGFLGLLGVVALIIIYLIKPNYQQKFVSSTYVWKISLRYRRKKLPVSRLRNLLLIICQILILLSLAALLTGPALKIVNANENEVVAIIDSSASMRVKVDGKTRYQRAVENVITLGNAAFDKGGMVSVIIADAEPSYLIEEFSQTDRAAFNDALNKLIENDTDCSYSESDINKAVDLTENVLDRNPEAAVYVYTDATYLNTPERVNLVNVTTEEEWNAAILDAYTELDENFYDIVFEVACYGNLNRTLDVNVVVRNANADYKDQVTVDVPFVVTVNCTPGQPKKIKIVRQEPTVEDMEEGVEYLLYKDVLGSVYENGFISYHNIEFSIGSIGDSFDLDNYFYLYGGIKETVRVLYSSSLPNPFYYNVMLSLRNNLSDMWDLEYNELKLEDKDYTEEEEKAAFDGYLQGYDFYIFEHKIPKELPTDGVVFIVDPNSAPDSNDAGFKIKGTRTYQGDPLPLFVGNDGVGHPILTNVVAENITVNRIVEITDLDPGYKTLLMCDDDKPVLIVKDEKDVKVAVLAFSVHWSNQVIDPGFPLMMYHMFDYFFPQMIYKNLFTVEDVIRLNSVSEKISVTDTAGKTTEYSEKTVNLTASLPGGYVVEQTSYFGRTFSERIFVRISAKESDIFCREDILNDPYKQRESGDSYMLYAVYIAAALVTLLFAEWLLHLRDNA